MGQKHTYYLKSIFITTGSHLSYNYLYMCKAVGPKLRLLEFREVNAREERDNVFVDGTRPSASSASSVHPTPSSSHGGPRQIKLGQGPPPKPREGEECDGRHA